MLLAAFVLSAISRKRLRITSTLATQALSCLMTSLYLNMPTSNKIEKSACILDPEGNWQNALGKIMRRCPSFAAAEVKFCGPSWIGIGQGNDTIAIVGTR